MASNAGNPFSQCFCCTECQDRTKDFQKIVDLKNIGLVIYHHVAEIQDKQNETDDDAKISEYVFIIENTKDQEITTAQYLPEIEQNKISCPRCRKIVEHAQRLLHTIPNIDKNVIRGICDHCLMAQKSCYKCEQIIQKFLSKAKELPDSTKNLIKQWLSKVKHVFKSIDVDDNIKDFESEKTRPGSDLYVDQLLIKSPKQSREPHVKQLFLPQTPLTQKIFTKGQVEDQIISLEEGQAFDQPAGRGLKEERLKILKSIPPVPFQSKEEMLAKIEHVLPSMRPKNLYFSIKLEDMDQLLGTSHEKKLERHYLRKYHSDESLLTIAKVTSKTDAEMRKDFSYFFPKKTKHVYPKRYASSSELIKETQDILQEKAEAERKNREMKVLRKLNIETKRKKARAERKAHLGATRDKNKFSKESPRREDATFKHLTTSMGQREQKWQPTTMREESKSSYATVGGGYKRDDRSDEIYEELKKKKRKGVSPSKTADVKVDKGDTIHKVKGNRHATGDASKGVESKVAKDSKITSEGKTPSTKTDRQKVIDDQKLEEKTEKVKPKIEYQDKMRQDKKQRQKYDKEDQVQSAKEQKQREKDQKDKSGKGKVNEQKQKEREGNEKSGKGKVDERPSKEQKQKEREGSEKSGKGKVDERSSKEHKQKERDGSEKSDKGKVDDRLSKEYKQKEDKVKSPEQQKEVEQKPKEKKDYEKQMQQDKIQKETKDKSTEKKETADKSTETPAKGKKQKDEKSTEGKEKIQKERDKDKENQLKQGKEKEKKKKKEKEEELKHEKGTERKQKNDRLQQEQKAIKEKATKEKEKDLRQETEKIQRDEREAKEIISAKAQEALLGLVQEKQQKGKEIIQEKDKNDKEEGESGSCKTANGKRKKSKREKSPKKKMSGQEATEKPPLEDEIAPKSKYVRKSGPPLDEPEAKDLAIDKIIVRRASPDDLILRLVRLKQTQFRGKKPKDLGELKAFGKKLRRQHKPHKSVNKKCLVCMESDLEFELDRLLYEKKAPKLEEIIIGPKIYKYTPPRIEMIQEAEEPSPIPLLFKSKFIQEDKIEPLTIRQPLPLSSPPAEKAPKAETDGKSPQKTETQSKKAGKQIKPSASAELEASKGIIRYTLSDWSFIEKGWTMLPTEKVVRKMNVYRMRPAQPQFDWFAHNKDKGRMTYDTGEILAEFDDNGRGRLYYRNGRLALDYYDAEELNANQRFVIWSSGEPDERGRAQPYTVLATFDYLGNGIVFDHTGKIRLKYNQTEGIVLDRKIGPVSHWKWHTLNDPPVLQQVMIDTQMPHKDQNILKLGGAGDDKSRPDNEEMLAIEFDNFIKEKSKKLTQSFKPFQIKMKALKINEHFSLRVMDQASVYLIYRDGTTNLKLNIGMILDHKEIVDTDTAEVGEVSNNLERFPARTDSLAGLQKSVAYAQCFERMRSARERRLRLPQTVASADKLTAAASRPLRPPLRSIPSDSSTTLTNPGYCCSRKPTRNNIYYDNRLF